MNSIVAQDKINRVIYLKNLYLVILILSVSVNCILAVSSYFKQKETILVPLSLSSDYKFDGKSYSPQYLEDLSRDIVQTMLNVTPENMKYIEQTLLQHVHPSYYGVLKDDLKTLFQMIKKKRVTTVFYPKSFVSDANTLTVIVKGQLHSYMGQHRVSIDKKSYKIEFAQSGHTLTFKKIKEHNYE